MWMLTVAALLAATEARPKAAVLGVRAEAGVSQGVGNTLATLLTEDLARSGRFDVYSSQELAVMLGVERQRQLGNCSDDSCLEEIGAALGADKLIDASVGTIGNLRVLSVRVIDGKTSKVEQRESATVDDETKLADALHELTAKMFGAPLPAAKKSRSAVPFVLLGAGGALAIGGGAVGAVALGNYNAYRAAPASPDREAMHSDARVLAGVADGLYAAALVTAAVGVVLLIVQGRGE